MTGNPPVRSEEGKRLMKFDSNRLARQAAVLLLIPFFLAAGCQKQSNSQQAAHQQAAHQNLAAGARPRLRVACADDLQKYCANADRKRRCLRDNIDKLSDACKAALSERRGRRANNGGGDE